jgi:hypothetical protein
LLGHTKRLYADYWTETLDKNDSKIIHYALWPLSVVLILPLVTTIPALAATASDESNKEDLAQERLPTQGDTYWIAPPSNFYPQYIADPRRAQSALLFMGFTESDIDSASSSRFGLRVGRSFGVARFHPKGDRTRGIQIDVEAGFFGQFDIKDQTDNIGWDGFYGVLASYKPNERFAVRFGTLHDSAHLGDEYMEETGRERIEYTREEIVAGASWAPHRRWRGYSEYGWAFGIKEFQARSRLQFGIEHFGDRSFWRDRFSWYAAMDFDLFEERDWEPATTAQLGLILPTGREGSRYRVALEMYHGRSVLGEFSFGDETYIALGFYFDS